jgi:hypothetical protein
MEILQTFEYNGQQLQIATYKPEDSPRPARSASRRAPGAGKFEIGQIKLSSATISAGEELTLTAQVSGRHIAQIYTELLLQDKGSNQLYGPVMRNYVQAERNKVTGGVSRPDWNETIHLSLRLHPGLRLLTDGSDSAFGFLLPSGYDSSDYCLDGLYTASAETSRRARITFDSAGKITQALAFKEKGGSAMPHAVTFKPGDQFAPFVQMLNPPTDENPAWRVTPGLSTPLTFRDQPLRWVTEAPMPGDYLAGLLVEDLDGTLTRQYSPLTIRE